MLHLVFILRAPLYILGICGGTHMKHSFELKGVAQIVLVQEMGGAQMSNMRRRALFLYSESHQLMTERF